MQRRSLYDRKKDIVPGGSARGWGMPGRDAFMELNLARGIP